MDSASDPGFRVSVGIDWEGFNWAILLSFVGVVSFIVLRVRRFIKWKRNRVGAQKVSMVRVDIPFTVSLELSKNVVAVVCSSVRCRVELYWDVNASELHKGIQGMWTEQVVLKSSCYRAQVSVEMKGGEKQFLLDYGKHGRPVPRTDYPVVIIVRNLSECLKPREGQALITMVHLGEFATSARIVAQSLKLASGQVTLLQRLFPSGLYEEGIRDLCVVCVEKPVSRVVLPCKHACLCHSCFERVITCPMCRAGIQSFFCISPEVETKNKTKWSSKLHSLVKSVWPRL